MQSLNRLFGKSPERGVESNVHAPLGLSIEQEARGDRFAESLFKTHGLGTKLHLIGAMTFRFSPFVFHNDDAAVPVEFHDIALAGQAQAFRAHGESARDAHPGPRFVGSLMGTFVQDAARCREVILLPFALDMDERALTFAVEQMLQRGYGKEIHAARGVGQSRMNGSGFLSAKRFSGES